MSLHTATEIQRNAQRSWDGRSPAEPNEQGFQFACADVANTLVEDGEVSQLVEQLSRSRHLMTHLMSQDVPMWLRADARELAQLVRSISGRVDESMGDAA
ncbi:hypothetical protein [Stenotrophomonas sp.]|uniref:hypothetical protein n=1 Tax=Stenotrophomonas sp. TaxID=69392 RepID=UPI00289D742E|nr:hypothetical protein [Stenotrophomonas sp.]